MELKDYLEKLIKDFKQRIKQKTNIILSIEGIPNTEGKYNLAFSLAEKLQKIIKKQTPQYKAEIKFNFINSLSRFKEEVLKLNAGDISIMRIYTLESLQKVFQIATFSRAELINFIFILHKTPLIKKMYLPYNYWLEIFEEDNLFVKCELSTKSFVLDDYNFGLIKIPISYNKNLKEEYNKKRNAFFDEIIKKIFKKGVE